MNLFPIQMQFLIPSLSIVNVGNEVFGSGTECGGAGEPWEHPTPLSCAPWMWMWIGGSSLDTAPLLLPGCSRAENAALCNNLTNSVSINSAKNV